MRCPKCNGAMIEVAGLPTQEGAAPVHKSCINCGEVIYPTESDGVEEEDKMAQTKVCNKCGKEKALSEFNKNATVADGHERACRPCIHIIQAETRNRIRQRDGKAIVPKKRGFKELMCPRPKNDNPSSILSDAVTLDAQLIKAVKKSVAQEIIAVIEKRYA